MIVNDPAQRGPHRPATATPPRQPASARRTSSIDTNRPDGLLGVMLMDARARDVVTTPDGRAAVTGEVRLSATVDGSSRTLLEIRCTPDEPALQGLLGALVGPGFRSRVDALLAHHRDAGSLLYLLLDDLPGAALVSGYALLRGGLTNHGPVDDAFMDRSADLCAGWASDAYMMTTIRARGTVPTPLGPVAPILEPEDDPMAWHAMAPLSPTDMRRRRLLDVPATLAENGELRVDAFFRDSYVDEAGVETVVHEYVVGAAVDPEARVVLGATAAPNVLPWIECPLAIGSADRAQGVALNDLRRHVRRTFVGTSTCTHLNDTLRSLSDVEVLLIQARGTAAPLDI